MPAAPRERPQRHTVLREFSGTVAAAPEAVLSSLPGTRYDTLVVEQGGWWYRGEYRVTASGSGSRIDFTLVNAASTAHWAGPIAGRAVLRDARRAFEQLLASFG